MRLFLVAAILLLVQIWPSWVSAEADGRVAQGIPHTFSFSTVSKKTTAANRDCSVLLKQMGGELAASTGSASSENQLVWRDLLMESGHPYGEFLSLLAQATESRASGESRLAEKQVAAALRLLSRQGGRRWFPPLFAQYADQFLFHEGGYLRGLSFGSLKSFLSFIREGNGSDWFKRFGLDSVRISFKGEENEALEGISDALTFLESMTQAGSLKNLEFDGETTEIGTLDFTRVWGKRPAMEARLQHLGLRYLSHLRVGGWIQKFKSLTSLDLSRSLLSDGDIPEVSRMKTVTRLSLDSFGTYLGGDIKALAQNMPQLTELSLTGHGAMNRDNCAHLSKLVHLTRLDIRQTLSFFRLDGIKFLAKGLVKLKYLAIRTPTFRDRGSHLAPLASMPALEIVDFGSDSTQRSLITREELKAFEKRPQMKLEGYWQKHPGSISFGGGSDVEL